ncbi:MULTISPECIES: DUF5819 family protein [Streptacidiphilus]|uniref:DUF5819 family protein n=1 Tax=Streptacidiphilus cavernicola TaxID=3342716 RepID=A0ABV6UPD6_9ACTN|nr:DUF5819 family protein [Streptacidiphilus jeojiense]
MPDHPNQAARDGAAPDEAAATPQDRDPIPGLAPPGPRVPPQRPAPDRTPEQAADRTPEPVPATASTPVPALAADGSTPRLWSLPALITLALTATALIVATAWHLGTVFLSIAPSNPASQRYQSAINSHVLPEFEQNWQLFAPNPLQNNIAVEARVQTLAPDGSRAESGWYDLTAQDISAVRGNPAPSHLNQNQLRRAWDYYTSWHNLPGETSLGTGGPLSKEYLKRIALQRIGSRDWQGNQIIQIEFRSATTPVTGPSWTAAAQKKQTSYVTLQWWAVSDDDYTGLGIHG